MFRNLSNLSEVTVSIFAQSSCSKYGWMSEIPMDMRTIYYLGHYENFTFN